MKSFSSGITVLALSATFCVLKKKKFNISHVCADILRADVRFEALSFLKHRLPVVQYHAAFLLGNERWLQPSAASLSPLCVFSWVADFVWEKPCGDICTRPPASAPSHVHTPAALTRGVNRLLVYINMYMHAHPHTLVHRPAFKRECTHMVDLRIKWSYLICIKLSNTAVHASFKVIIIIFIYITSFENKS